MLHNYYAVCFEGVIQALDTLLNMYIMNSCSSTFSDQLVTLTVASIYEHMLTRLKFADYTYGVPLYDTLLLAGYT